MTLVTRISFGCNMSVVCGLIKGTPGILRDKRSRWCNATLSSPDPDPRTRWYLGDPTRYIVPTCGVHSQLIIYDPGYLYAHLSIYLYICIKYKI